MLLTIIVFIIILSILVFAHELGHFFTARRFGVSAEEFGLGFPPRVLGVQTWRESELEKIAETEELKVELETQPTVGGQEIVKEIVTDKIREIDTVKKVRKWRLVWGAKELSEEDKKLGTVYSINWFPLGGFVKIKGENGEAENEKDSFASRSIWQRFIMLAAGVSMNIILAMFLIIVGFMVGLPQVLDEVNQSAIISDRKIQVVEVMADSPAQAADLKIGDIIESINGQSFSDYNGLQEYVAARTGQNLDYKIKRGQEILDKNITPSLRPETGQAGVGVGIAITAVVRYPWYAAIWQGIKTTFILMWQIILAFYQVMAGLIMGRGVSGELAGPVGIAAITGQVVKMGFIYILQFTALLSINLAIINFLPFPALDGGRALFLAIEKIKGSPVKRQVEAVIHNIGFILLMLLVLLVTFRDVFNLSGGFRMVWERIFG